MAGRGPAIHVKCNASSFGQRLNLKALFLKLAGDFADLAARVFRDSLRVTFEKRYSDNFAGDYYCHISESLKYNLIRWDDEASGEYIFFIEAHPPLVGDDALIEKLLTNVQGKLQEQGVFAGSIDVGSEARRNQDNLN
jgi:hypothetical protein